MNTSGTTVVTMIWLLVSYLLPGTSMAITHNAAELTPPLSYFVQAKTNAVPVEDPRYLNAHWEPIQRSELNMGFTDDVVWVRFDIPSDQQRRNLMLEVANHKIDHLEVFVYKLNTTGQDLHSRFSVGDHLPIHERPYPARNFIFPIEVQAHQPLRIYMRFQSRYPMKLPLNVWTPEQLERRNEARILFQGIYFGVVSIMALYNLCIYFFVRDRSYGTYSFFIVCLAAFIMIERGLAIEYLWPSNPGFDFQMSLIITALGSAASIPFTVHFLSLNQYAPRIAHAYRYLFRTWLVLAALGAIYPAVWLVYVVVIILIPGSLSLAIVGMLMWRKGVPAAPFYTLAWFVLVSAVSVYDAYIMGFLPITAFTEYSLQVGNMIEVTLLSLGLAHRIKSLDREKREAHLLTKTKSEFLATMSHEIRTPMNGILGMAELLQDTKLDQQQSSYLNTILSSGKTLMTVLNDILDYSKIEAGKLELESVSYPVRRLIDDTASIFSVVARDKALYFNIYVSPRVPASINGDATRVRQILSNLLSNAFKFTHEGQVTLTADCDADATQLIIKVSDSGVGVPEHKKRSIFEQFTQAERSTSRQYGGTGLGLSISKRFVELMGGNIGLQSTIGAGSTFWFTLPLVSPKQFNLSNPEDLKPLAAQLRILLICPDRRFTRLIDDYRAMWGFQLSICHSLHEAQHQLNEMTKQQTGQQQVFFHFVLIDQYCEDFTCDQVNHFIQDNPALMDTNLVLTVKAGFPRDRIKGGNKAPIFEEYPVCISAIQLALLDRIGFNRKLPTTPLIRSDFSGTKILVVDDNPVNTKVICGYLSKLNVHPDCAASGQEALDKIIGINHQYDLIFMDCEMPGIDGYEATLRIRQWELHNNRAQQTICALSAHAMKNYRDRCFEVGMNDFLSKPIVMAELKILLNRHCNQQTTTADETADEGPAPLL
ncbi:MAG: hypothetical protein CSH49_02690 [Alcanivorax sp.]|nr:MAG: hypothetical protein CSH49_02690 [Alcanivorax sp.]